LLQLYFIRHAQSQNNHIMDSVDRKDYLFQRVEDPKLTEKGLRQADLVGAYLARPEAEDGNDPQNRIGFGLTHLYCSLMTRAVQTALPIARETGLPLVAWPEVHENGGVFLAEKVEDEIIWNGLPGKGRSYFETHFPELIIPDDLPEEGWWNREKEPRDQYIIRAKSIVDRLLEEHQGTDHRVGIVMHGGIFSRILAAIFEMESHAVWFHMNNTAISRFNIRDNGRVTFSYMNNVTHLPNDLIT
jgi:2,3-bisphosphoglycerate-dependent phosphoglycerate mutase